MEQVDVTQISLISQNYRVTQISQISQILSPFKGRLCRRVKNSAEQYKQSWEKKKSVRSVRSV